MAEYGPIKLPTEKEIAALPRWAQVAFAARCARRVQPLLILFWPRAGPQHVKTLEEAIVLAQALAADPTRVSHVDAGPVSEGVLRVYSEAAQVSSVAAAAAQAAKNAVDAAFLGAAALIAPTSPPSAAAARAASAAYDAVGDARVLATYAMRRDFELLRNAADQEHWTDDTPVPLELIGPLWPDGEPEWWPTSEHVNRSGGLPTADEIARIPRWAKVAFAARCALRVLPLYRPYWLVGPYIDGREPKRYWETLRDGILLAQSAAEATKLTLVREAGDVVKGTDDVASDAGIAAAGSAHDGRFFSEDAIKAGAAFSAACAAGAAARSAVAANTSDGRAVLDYTITAMTDAESAVARFDRAATYHAPSPSSKASTAAMQHDFELLRLEATRGQWTDDTPVPPEFFGPLWPDREPAGWPAETPEAGQTDEIAGPISVYIDPAVYTPEEAGEFLSILSALHELEFGERLVIDEAGSGEAIVLIPATTPGGGS